MPQSIGTPRAEIEIDEALARRLLRTQHPDLAELPLEMIEAGWDNVMFRLGDALSLRMPRREAAAALIANEQRWLGELEARLPLPIPAPVRAGNPGEGYPWRWSVLRWCDGNAADLARPRPDQAEPLAAFLRALHTAAPADAPANPYRGCPLCDRADATEARLARLAESTDLIDAAITDAWQQALAAAPSREARWLHGDLHPRNVLVDEGRISAIIDWGDLCSGDVATDLAAIWGLLGDSDARSRALSAYGVSEDERRRALGWAVFFGAVLADTGLVDNPRHLAIGECFLRRVSEDVRRAA